MDESDNYTESYHTDEEMSQDEDTTPGKKMETSDKAESCGDDDSSDSSCKEDDNNAGSIERE